MYGSRLFASLIFRTTAWLLSFTSCNFSLGGLPFEITVLVANFCYLTSLATETVSIISLCYTSSQLHESCNSSSADGEFSSSPDTPPSPSSCCPKKRIVRCIDTRSCQVFGSAFFLVGLPLSMVLQQAFGSEDVKKLISDQLHVALANYSCSFYPCWGTIYFLIIPAQLIMVLQLATIAFAFYATQLRLMKRVGKPVDQLIIIEHQDRLWAALKVAFGQMVGWLLAFVSVFYGSASLWHMFTLSSSLHSIFLAVSCILSRAVLCSLQRQHHREYIDANGTMKSIRPR